MYLPWLKKYNLLTFDKIDSTNSEAIRLVKAGVRGDHIIWASSQSLGRGTHGRHWTSEYGNLYLSLLLDRNIITETLPQLSFVAALALRSTIAQIAGKEKQKLIGLKWPNDVLYDGKKIGGILLESIKVKAQNYLIIGVGVNILNCPTNLDRPVTSLLAEGIVVKKYGQELNIFMHHFDKFFDKWQNKGFGAIRKEWLSGAEYLHKTVCINDGNNNITGIFKTISKDGTIVIKLASGERINISSGEVANKST